MAKNLGLRTPRSFALGSGWHFVLTAAVRRASPRGAQHRHVIVSRAAVKLNQSQPAVSTALKRLCEIFNDPLLMREGAAMVPTERALQLRDGARTALGEIDRMLADPERFDPAASQQTFHVASPDYLAMGFPAGAVEQMRADAPRARLVVHPLGPDTTTSARWRRVSSRS